MTHSVELHAVGDIMLFGRYDQIAQPSQLFESIKSVWAAADVVVGNLECVLSAQGEAQPGKLCLRGHPVYAGALAESGLRVLSLANNHAFDFGVEAFMDMQERLVEQGVVTLGAGLNLAAAREAKILNVRGLRLGFLAYCHASTRNLAFASDTVAGVAPLVPEMMFADIEDLRPRVDHIVLLLHWGLEYAALPTPEQVQLAHSAVDRGVSLVLGHHSHMVQGIERYGHRVIAYSLGNLTDADVDLEQHGKHYQYRMKDVDRESLVLRVRLEPDSVELLEPIPLWLSEEGAPVPAQGERRDKIIRDLAERTAALSSPDLTAEWEARLIQKRVVGPLLYWWRSGSLLDKIRRFRLGQLKTLYLLIRTFIRIRFSRSEERWSLFNPRNDTEPMPYAGEPDETSRPVIRVDLLRNQPRN